MLAVALTAAALTASPREKPTQPASDRAARWRDREVLSPQEESELLAVLKEKRPQRYQALTALRERNPKRYRSAVRDIWRWYQRWKHLPPEVQDAHIAELDCRAEIGRLVHAIRTAGDEEDRDSLEEQLRQVIRAQFQAEQVRREHQLAVLAERLRQLRQELQEQSARPDRVVQRRFEYWLEVAEKSRRQGHPHSHGPEHGPPHPPAH